MFTRSGVFKAEELACEPALSERGAPAASVMAFHYCRPHCLIGR